MKGFNLVTEIVNDPNSLGIDAEQISQTAGQPQKLNVPAIFSGAGTPTATATVPSKAGDIYVDTTNSKIYVAKAATAESDFLILN